MIKKHRSGSSVADIKPFSIGMCLNFCSVLGFAICNVKQGSNKKSKSKMGSPENEIHSIMLNTIPFQTRFENVPSNINEPPQILNHILKYLL